MKQYYYLDAAEQQHGPVDALQLPEVGATTDTLVWTEGMDNWTPIKKIDELVEIFAAPREQPTPFVVAQSHEVAPEIAIQEAETWEEAKQIIADDKEVPQTYMIMSVICTLCFSPIFGIIAMYNAYQVPKHYFRGDKLRAIRHSERARVWSLAGFLSFTFFMLAYQYIKTNGLPTGLFG